MLEGIRSVCSRLQEKKDLIISSIQLFITLFSTFSPARKMPLVLLTSLIELSWLQSDLAGVEVLAEVLMGLVRNSVRPLQKTDKPFQEVMMSQYNDDYNDNNNNNINNNNNNNNNNSNVNGSAGPEIIGCQESRAPLNSPAAPSIFCREPKDVLFYTQNL